MPKLYLVTSPSVSNSSFLPIYCPGTHILFFSSSPLTVNKKNNCSNQKNRTKKMCYPGSVPLVGIRELAVQSRWFVLQAPIGIETGTRQASTAVVGGAEEGVGGGGGSVKQCVCSPTRHPGSFRCRQHHAGGYVWGGRMLRNGSSD
jgi:hypothetical protein